MLKNITRLAMFSLLVQVTLVDKVILVHQAVGFQAKQVLQDSQAQQGRVDLLVSYAHC